MCVKHRLLLAILATVPTSFAGTILYSQSGVPGFGFDGQAGFVIGFETTSTWQNVSVSLPLEDLNLGGPISGVEGTFYLTNQIGTGTTVANQVAVDQVSGLSSSFSDVTLFSSLLLDPGSYYLVMVPTDNGGGNPNTGWTSSPEGVGAPNPVTVGTGVTDLGDSGFTTLAPYAPASTLADPLLTPDNLYVTITGDPVAAPEPSTFLLLLAGIATVALNRSRIK